MKILLCIVTIFSVFGLFLANSVIVNCGIKPVQEQGNGTEANSGRSEWPWLARIGYKPDHRKYKSGKFFCGGTLVSLRSVLTTAYCVYDESLGYKLRKSDLEVQLGRRKFQDGPQDDVKVLGPILMILVHPDFNTESEQRNDVNLALIIAKNDLDPSPFIAPICFPENDFLFVTWGFLGREKDKEGDFASKAKVEKISNADCLLQHPELMMNGSQNTFCVKGLEGESVNVTAGEGFYVENNNVWSIYGTALSGYEIEGHSVFTQVSGQWMKEKLAHIYPVPVPVSYSLGKPGKDQDDDYYSIYPKTSLKIASEPLARGAYLSTHLNPESYFNSPFISMLICEGSNWKYLPNDVGKIFPNLERFSANQLQITSIDRFNFQGFGRLTHLYLYGNLIENIPMDCFSDLSEVEFVSLQSNKLKSIHPGTFKDLPLLLVINLGGNEIDSIQPKNFANEKVATIVLNWNKLESIDPEAFDDMKKLQHVYLESNKLTTIHNDTFSKNPALYSLSVKNNKLQSLPAGLFRNNKNLRGLNFETNQLTKIETTFLKLDDYSYSGSSYFFDNNTCIQKDYEVQSDKEMDEMNEELKRLC